MGGMGGIGGQSAMTGFRFGSVTRTAIVGPDAKSSYGILKGKALYFFQQSDEAAEFEIAADILGEDLRAASSPTATVSWEPGVYHLNTIVVMRPAPPVAQTPDSRKRFGVISACSSFGAAFTTIGQPTLHRIGPPTTTQLENPDADAPTRIPDWNWGEIPIQVPAEYWTTPSNRFEIRAGQKNEWTIPLPEQLVKAVRERLKQAAKAAQERKTG